MTEKQKCQCQQICTHYGIESQKGILTEECADKGAEKMRHLGGRVNLVICQKSKIDDWKEHFETHYESWTEHVYNLSVVSQLDVCLWEWKNGGCCVGIINYDLIFRRPELLKVKFDTIVLDESSMIQNETAKRTKAILKLKTNNVILLSGTPTGG